MARFLVSICRSSECLARGSPAIESELTALVTESGADAKIQRGGCWGLCNLGPNIVVREGEAAARVQADIFAHDASFQGRVGEYHYGSCTTDSVKRIAQEHLVEGHAVTDLASTRETRATAKKLSTD